MPMDYTLQQLVIGYGELNAIAIQQAQELHQSTPTEGATGEKKDMAALKTQLAEAQVSKEAAKFSKADTKIEQARSLLLRCQMPEITWGDAQQIIAEALDVLTWKDGDLNETTEPAPDEAPTLASRQIEAAAE